MNPVALQDDPCQKRDAGPGKSTESSVDIEIGLLTGCRDKPYVYGLTMALLSKGIGLDLIGSDDVDSPDFHASPKMHFLNMCAPQRREDSRATKLFQLIQYYSKLFPYTIFGKRKLYHILWNYKLEYFDRTLLMMYYKFLGKKIVLTLHNVNAGKRDSNDSLLNQWTLKIQYRLANHIFVHTEKMKAELLGDFGIRSEDATVIPFGVNNDAPNTDLTVAEAKQRLGIRDGEKTILFFGNIGPYKGVEYLIAAFEKILARGGEYRLIIAGKPRKGAEKYVNEIREAAKRLVEEGRILLRIEFVPDQETELYFKAADVLALPYTFVAQSGVLFLGYSFGIPVVATDVGSMADDIVEGDTGFLCRPSDPVDLARAIETYFESDLFKNLNSRRQAIRDYVHRQHSWDVVGDMTRDVYAELLRSDRA